MTMVKTVAREGIRKTRTIQNKFREWWTIPRIWKETNCLPYVKKYSSPLMVPFKVNIWMRFLQMQWSLAYFILQPYWIKPTLSCKILILNSWTFFFRLCMLILMWVSYYLLHRASIYHFIIWDNPLIRSSNMHRSIETIHFSSWNKRFPIVFRSHIIEQITCKYVLSSVIYSIYIPKECPQIA